MMKRCIVFVLLFIAVLSGWGKDSRKVSLQLQWADQFQFAGYYVAIEKGFYKEQGLDVTLLPFNPKREAIDIVVGGEADFGIGRSSLLIDRLEGKKIVALAAIFQNSPFILLSDARKNIKTPQDLAGKRVMMTQDFLDTVTIQAMLTSQKVDYRSLQFQQHSYNPMDIVNGKTDVMASYSSNEPFVLSEKGYKTNGINPADYGFDVYSDILFTTEKMLQNDPKTVEKFYTASLKGWEYAFAHLRETAQMIHAKYNSQHKSLASLVFEGEVLKQLAYANNATLGMIENRKLERLMDLYRLMGKVYPKENIEGFVYADQGKHRLPLTADEHIFLHTHSIKAAVTSQWPPFNFKMDKDSPLIGIGIDMWNEVMKQNGIHATLKEVNSWDDVLNQIKAGQSDLTVATSIADERSDYAIYSKPYAHFSNVIATNKSMGYVSGLKAFNRKKIAIGEKYAVLAQIAKEYPLITIIRVKNTSEGLKLLEKGEVDGVVDLLPVLSNLINKGGYLNLHIGGETEFKSDLRFMIRKDLPQLKSIIDRSIDHISDEQKEQILNRYTSIVYAQPFDLIWAKRIGSIALVIILFLGWRHYELGKYSKKLQELTVTDPLTLLHNRLKIDEKLAYFHRMYLRNGRGYSIIMLDIDNFKTVNDTYGHQIGDKVLIRVAELLKTHSRVTDLVGRWGGEEFMIVCPETTLGGAENLANKINEIIAQEDFEVVRHLTCSFGVSEVQPQDKVEKVVKRADDALYMAKNEGRNKVVSLH